MNTYELTLLFPEEKDSKEKKRVMKSIEDFVTKKKGKIVKQESWGVKYLAYPIKKNHTGEYEHYVLELDPKHRPALEDQIRIEEQLMRYLFVRV